MEFKRRYGRRKKANPKKGLYLVVLLVVVIYLWFNAEKIITKIL
ncbi:hypothetical protein [Tenacibaculum litopenaei]